MAPGWAKRGLGLALAMGGVGILVSCTRDPELVDRPVFVYSLRSCPVAQSEAFSVIYGAGDFEPSLERPPIASVFLRDVGYAMTDLPKETRSLVVDVSAREIAWRGFTDLPRSGPINVLVWPGSDSCRLNRDVERRTDMTIGVVGQRILVAGGRSLDGSQVPNTYVGDLTTGAIERLVFGLNARRSRPTITAFRAPTDPEGLSGALVAGGHDPDSDAPETPLRALATAEVYVPKAGGPGEFEQQRIDLVDARTRHGAVVLAGGQTLLVGGRGPAGPLRTMEIVDPVTRRARLATSLLSVARENPTVLRLATGEIMVAGGVDARGGEVPTIEWFSPDVSRSTKRPVDLVTGRERAFVPLEAGGALAVIVPEKPSPDFRTVWIISADGTLEPAVPIDPATLDMVRLFQGAEGAPAIWTGRHWMRWSPWFGAFQPIVDAPERGGTQPAPGPSLNAIANGDSGLALWLDDRVEAGMNITGFRFATRTRFGAVPKPLLITGPEQLAPDRLAGFPGSSIRFEAERGLLLGPGASAFLTDVTFADFELEVDVTGAAATIVLRDERGVELEVGGAGCAFAQAAKERLTVTRRGRRVSVVLDADAARSCPSELEPNARVSLGLRGAQGSGLSGARNLRVTRR